MAENKFELHYEFKDQKIVINQYPREKSTDENGVIDNTGWTCWECSNIMLRYLSKNDRIFEMSGIGGENSSQKLSVLDLSSGAGLVSISVAAGYPSVSVIATEIPQQLDQLRKNIELANLQGRIQIYSYLWGEPISESIWKDDGVEHLLGNKKAGRIAIASDLLFIAIRDNRASEFSSTLISLTKCVNCVFLGFEERLIDEETEFMKELGKIVHVTEITGSELSVEFSESLQGQGGGHPDTNLWIPTVLFWESPPMKMFLLKEKVEQ